MKFVTILLLSLSFSLTVWAKQDIKKEVNIVKWLSANLNQNKLNQNFKNYFVRYTKNDRDRNDVRRAINKWKSSKQIRFVPYLNKLGVLVNNQLIYSLAVKQYSPLIITINDKDLKLRPGQFKKIIDKFTLNLNKKSAIFNFKLFPEAHAASRKSESNLSDISLLFTSTFQSSQVDGAFDYIKMLDDSRGINKKAVQQERRNSKVRVTKTSMISDTLSCSGSTIKGQGFLNVGKFSNYDFSVNNNVVQFEFKNGQKINATIHTGPLTGQQCLDNAIGICGLEFGDKHDKCRSIGVTVKSIKGVLSIMELCKKVKAIGCRSNGTNNCDDQIHKYLMCARRIYPYKPKLDMDNQFIRNQSTPPICAGELSGALSCVNIIYHSIESGKADVNNQCNDKINNYCGQETASIYKNNKNNKKNAVDYFFDETKSLMDANVHHPIKGTSLYCDSRLYDGLNLSKYKYTKSVSLETCKNGVCTKISENNWRDWYTKHYEVNDPKMKRLETSLKKSTVKLEKIKKDFKTKHNLKAIPLKCVNATCEIKRKPIFTGPTKSLLSFKNDYSALLRDQTKIEEEILLIKKAAVREMSDFTDSLKNDALTALAYNKACGDNIYKINLFKELGVDLDSTPREATQ